MGTDNIQLFCDDCNEGLKKLEEDSVDLTVTSPPYDNLRTYGSKEVGTLDWRATLEELYRVTKPGGGRCVGSF